MNMVKKFARMSEQGTLNLLLRAARTCIGLTCHYWFYLFLSCFLPPTTQHGAEFFCIKYLYAILLKGVSVAHLT